MDTTDGDARLRVLCLEDSAPDAELVREALIQGGLEVDMDLATERGRFEELLASSKYEVILADFSLPGFDAHAALALTQAATATTPFICVSGTIGEEATVELLKQGAADCVLKNRLERLPFAVERAIAEAGHRETLRESEERFALLFNEAPSGYQALDEHGCLLAVNTAWLEMLGYGHDEVVGRWFGEFLTPKAAAAFRERFETFKARGAIHSEWEMVRKGGELRVVAFEGRIAHSPDGAFLQTHCILTDITERKQAEEARRRSMALLNRGESLAHLGSWEWDVASGTTMVSNGWQRQHGVSCERLGDGELFALCHPDDREALRTAVERLTAGEPQRVAHRIVRADTGAVRHLLTYGEPHFDAQGTVEAVIGASLDVTERVQADEVLREREERLQRALADTVAALGATVAMRDPYTASHERRVSELACRIAIGLEWSEEAIDRLRTAALVHDIGKITIPAEILSKPGRLTETEFALIKSHSAAAYEILAPIDFGGPVAEIVLQHHERLDGSGYPHGLSGEEILPGARVLAIADVVEAMITHRPYRAALSLDEALAEIESGAGSRYDAAASRTAVRLFREEGFAFSG